MVLNQEGAPVWYVEGHNFASVGFCRVKVRWFLTGHGKRCYERLPVTWFSTLPVAPQMRSLGKC